MIGRLVHRLAVLVVWTVLGLFGGLFLAVSVPYLFGERASPCCRDRWSPSCTSATWSSWIRCRRSRSASATS